MTGKAIGIDMNQGYAGGVSRITPVPEVFTRPAGEALTFGQPLAVVDGKFVGYASTNTLDEFAGICCRSVNQATAYIPQTGETGYAVNKSACALKKGFIIVNVGSSTPAAGGKVYLTSAGAFTATDTDNTDIVSARFTTGKKDANNNAEIEIGYLPMYVYTAPVGG